MTFWPSSMYDLNCSFASCARLTKETVLSPEKRPQGGGAVEEQDWNQLSACSRVVSHDRIPLLAANMVPLACPGNPREDGTCSSDGAPLLSPQLLWLPRRPLGVTSPLPFPPDERGNRSVGSSGSVATSAPSSAASSRDRTLRSAKLAVRVAALEPGKGNSMVSSSKPSEQCEREAAEDMSSGSCRLFAVDASAVEAPMEPKMQSQNDS
mmetsp:Transcript_25740/g.58589  ORF Transcript_25740/g.58589 Transcript_25740/m.58589 type:complete len:209 (-) Transcript_25740:277-903(-)